MPQLGSLPLPHVVNKVIENLDGVVGNVDSENEAICRNLERKGEERATRDFTLGKPHNRADIRAGDEAELQSVRGDSLVAIHHPEEHLLPLAELRPGTARFK